jgi:hypothetical protein
VFYDDVALSVTPVPEPATLAVMGMGALALLRRGHDLSRPTGTARFKPGRRRTHL